MTFSLSQPAYALPGPVRRAVCERAGFRCERCGEPTQHQNAEERHLGLDFHHINGLRGEGMSEQASNGD